MIRIDAALEPAAVAETVTVTGAAPVVDIGITVYAAALLAVQDSRPRVAVRVEPRPGSLLELVDHGLICASVGRSSGAHTSTIELYLCSNSGESGRRPSCPGRRGGLRRPRAHAPSRRDRRGLRDVRLAISDAQVGLKQAVGRVLGGARWQRCRVHVMRNLLALVPHAAREAVAAVVRCSSYDVI